MSTFPFFTEFTQSLFYRLIHKTFTQVSDLGMDMK